MKYRRVKVGRVRQIRVFFHCVVVRIDVDFVHDGRARAHSVFGVHGDVISRFYFTVGDDYSHREGRFAHHSRSDYNVGNRHITFLVFGRNVPVDDVLRVKRFQLRGHSVRHYVYSRLFGEGFARFHYVQRNRRLRTRNKHAVLVVNFHHVFFVFFAVILRITRAFVVIKRVHFTEFAVVFAFEHYEVASYFAHKTTVRSRSVLRFARFGNRHRVGIVFEQQVSVSFLRYVSVVAVGVFYRAVSVEIVEIRSAVVEQNFGYSLPVNVHRAVRAGFDILALYLTLFSVIGTVIVLSVRFVNEHIVFDFFFRRVEHEFV